MAKPIVCYECEKPIETRDELAVVGKTFITFHRSCYETTKKLSAYKKYFGLYRINGPFIWALLISINLALLLLLFSPTLDKKEFIIFISFFNIIFLGFRILSYFAYEMKLPKK